MHAFAGAPVLDQKAHLYGDILRDNCERVQSTAEIQIAQHCVAILTIADFLLVLEWR